MDWVEIEKFGGLNLEVDQSDNSQAAYTRNVVLDRDLGGFTTRKGYTVLATPTVFGPGGLFNSTVAPLLVGGSFGGVNQYRGYNTSGTLLHTSPTVGSPGFRAVNYGSPTIGSITYMVNGVDPIWRYDGSALGDGAAFTNPSGGGAPSAFHIAVSPFDNRLVVGRTSVEGSRVQFSKAGDPETWTETSSPSGMFVDLAPGTGNIEGLATYSNQLFAFKKARFYVFYGVSTTTSGAPIFNYRTVDAGIGHDFTYGAPVVGLEGVYFTDGQDIYVTTGGTPQRISDPIAGFLQFRVSVSGYTNQNFVPWNMSYVDGRLYVNVSSTGLGPNNMIALVFDPVNSQWTVNDLGVPYACTVGGIPYILRTNQINVWNNTSDNGTAITTDYRTGWLDFGAPESKVIKQLLIDGLGLTATAGVAVDYANGAPTMTALSTFASTDLHQARVRVATRGRRFQIYIQGTDPLRINNVAVQLRDARAGR